MATKAAIFAMSDENDPLKRAALIRRVLVIAAFATSTFGLLPFTVYQLFGDKLEPWHLAALFLCCFGIIFIVLARALRSDNKIRSAERKFRSEAAAVLDGTYRCVTPQVMNSMVVFPVKVHNRDAKNDSILMLADDSLVVQLAQGGKIGPPVTFRDGQDGMRQREIAMKRREEDTASRLTRLIDSAINSSKSSVTFGIKIFSGSSSGPTGLAAGVSCPGYGPTLARFIGSCLERVQEPATSFGTNIDMPNGKIK